MKVVFKGFFYNHTLKRVSIVPFGLRHSANSSLVKASLVGEGVDICSRKQSAINYMTLTEGSLIAFSPQMSVSRANGEQKVKQDIFWTIYGN